MASDSDLGFSVSLGLGKLRFKVVGFGECSWNATIARDVAYAQTSEHNMNPETR